MLILTGQRLTEISALSWSEVDLKSGVITIAAKRMKGGAAHEVPPGPMALQTLSDPALPKWTKGNFVFSTTDRHPAAGFRAIKLQLDKLSGVRD
jgi:integrase